jgi:hypothetical protein
MDDQEPFSVRAIHALIRRVGVWRVAWWFVAINVPIALLLSAVFAWRGNQPGTREVVLRLALAMVLFGGGTVLFTLLVWRAGKGRKTLPSGE